MNRLWLLLLTLIVFTSCSTEEEPLEEFANLVIDCKCDYVTTEIVIKTTQGTNGNTTEKISEIELSRVSDPNPNCFEEKVERSFTHETESHLNENPAYTLSIYTENTYNCYGDPNPAGNYGCGQWYLGSFASTGGAVVDEYIIFFGNDENEYSIEVNKPTYDYYLNQDNGEKICWEGRK